MSIIQIKSPTEPSLLAASKLLKDGQAIVFPTETVYGIGADAANDSAIEKLYQIKGRSTTKPLQILVQNVQSARKIGEFNQMAEKLASHFWPGPLTIVLKRKKNAPISDLVSPEIETIGLRIPANKMTLKMLRMFGQPLASTSANFSGMESSVNAIEAAGSVGALVPFVIDGGACTLGISSTVVDATGKKVKILREGAIAKKDLLAVL